MRHLKTRMLNNKKMEIKDLTEYHLPTYLKCLEDWSDEMEEAGDHKENWYRKMKDKGLRIKLAIDDNGVAVGMIQYIPIEESFAEGKNLYFIYCIWVHGYKEGKGNYQKRGFGKTLLQAAESDVKSLGAKGIVAWGVSLPFFMRASWFKKQGYTKVDKQGIQVLLWKPFTEDAEPPMWVTQKKKPKKIPGKVTVTAFTNGWCPAQNLVFERAKRASLEFKDKVVFREINTLEKHNFMNWGITDALYIDKKQVRTGPPPSYEKIIKHIKKRVKKL